MGNDHWKCSRRPSCCMIVFRLRRIFLCAARRQGRQRTKRGSAWNNWVGATPYRPVACAIESHRFSAGITPTSIRCPILQDADRLDAIGFPASHDVSIPEAPWARDCNGPAYPWEKPRPPDDSRYALDHFPKKLLTLEGNRKTAEARSWRAKTSTARCVLSRHALRGTGIVGLLSPNESRPHRRC